MPISKSIKKGLKDFYEYGRNENDDIYDEDFDASTDSEREDKSKMNYSKENVNKTKDDSHGSAKSKRQLHGTSAGYGSVYSEPLDSARREYGSSYSKVSGGYKLKKDNRKGRGEYASRPPQSTNVITQRVLSARRNKINSLQNLVLELQNEVEKLRIENRDLKRSSRIQEKVIKKLDDEEADLPLLLQKHNTEVRTLKEKLKKQKERSEKMQEEIKKKDLELMKLRDKVRKYEEIMKEKRLDERERLQHKLEKLESELGEKEGKIIELEKVVKLSEKVRVRELKERNDKYKRAIDELRRLEHMQRDLQDKFKEKEKELHTQNIYSQRIALKRKAMKSQHLLMDSRIEDTPTSLRNEDYGTPRLINETDDKATAIGDSSESSKLASSDVNVETMVSALRKKEEELEKMLEEERKRKQFEEDKRRLKEMEDKIKQKQYEIEQGDKQRDEERRLDEEREERLKKEEEARKLQEIEDEKKKIEHRSRQMEEELKVIKRLEAERAKEGQRRTAEVESKDAEIDLSRKLAEQRDRQKILEDQLKTEKAMAINDEESKRKKDILLARMKAIDERKSVQKADKFSPGNQSSKSNTGNSQLLTKSQKKEPIFLEDSSNDDKEDGIKHVPLDFSSKRRGSKEYNFKAADENLHRGLPSHADVSKKNEQDVAFGAYSSTINSGSAGQKRVSQYKSNDKKVDKNEDFLFFDTNVKSSPGESSRRNEKKEDILFFDTKKAKAPVPVDKPQNQAAVRKISGRDKKPELNRNRTKSISDDDSLMFTIGGKNPDRFKSERGSGDSRKDRKSTAGSGQHVFGGYEPTFGNPESANSTGVLSPGSDPFAEDGAKFGRRQGQQKNSDTFGEILSLDKTAKKTNDFTNNLFDSSRKKADKVGTSAVRAIDSFVDDDIEEMVLT